MPFKSVKKVAGMKAGGKVKKYEDGGDIGDYLSRERTESDLAEKAAQPRANLVRRRGPSRAKKASMISDMTKNQAGLSSYLEGQPQSSPVDEVLNYAKNRAIANKSKTTNMKTGGNVKAKMGGMHEMPNGKMMKDSAMKKGSMPMKDGKPAFMMKKKMMGGGMAGYAKGGVIKMASSGSVDGIAQRGKTKGKMC